MIRLAHSADHKYAEFINGTNDLRSNTDSVQSVFTLQLKTPTDIAIITLQLCCHTHKKGTKILKILIKVEYA